MSEMTPERWEELFVALINALEDIADKLESIEKTLDIGVQNQ